ncbi:ABC transporter substrate-binding protein [Kaistia dalseonensis]|uniref:Peptide/nickel transport system substrate-binding protein n=1 Tax=Kaistia dalseonensis TaxID=410840 RepID=A0ABU0H7M8_9HYPH|nr:ABC transporter substrate-binding protein [Kaistia dalseonensis]MCX5495705.1 ABC transporter substrate-binding protein [Kaistia dalseonensis]MDQ0438301.1 peptide/nickel transport system substrate-binding protein [Kaistia dalseonensis]
MVNLKSIAGAMLVAATMLTPVASFAQSGGAGLPAAQEIAPKGALPVVPRNETLVLGWGVAGGTSMGTTNPWVLPGYTHQEGNNLLFEPLMYFAIFKGEYIPWLADSMEYTSPDFTSLEIKLNKDAKWSDGKPVTSKDVVYTFEGQMQRETLPYHAHFQQFVESVTAKDDLTVEVKFKQPAPRFKFEVLTEKFDTGLPIVPEHWEAAQADPTKAVGLDQMPHSGPYDIVAWNANQKIMDLRPDWWGVKAGRSPEPAVKRVVVVNVLNQPMDTVAQRLVNNEFDSSVDMRAQIIGNILEQNKDIQSWTGTESPYGYLDWWPNSLWMNDQLPPYNDVRVRKAISLAIDRDKIDEVLYDGAKIATIYPFPLYPNLQKFADSDAVKAEAAKYEPGKFDLEESAKLMTEAGFTKNSDGLWEKDGKTFDATIQAFENIHGDIAPVLAEMLRQAGFDANVNFGTDAYQNMVDGKAGLYMFGHGASLYDPFEALNLFHGKYSNSIGSAAGNNRFSRYKNEEFDKILDEISPLGSDDPKFQEGAAKAMGIYWRDVIDVPVIQWLHRIPYNNHYWKNWPSSTNVASGTNGAFWAHTGLPVIVSLQPTGAQ